MLCLYAGVYAAGRDRSANVFIRCSNLDEADIAYTCMLCLESTRQPGYVHAMVIDDVSTMLVREPDKEVRLETRGISVVHRDRVVTWRCRSSSMYGGTEVDKALCVMTASLYWMRCWTGSH